MNTLKIIFNSFRKTRISIFIFFALITKITFSQTIYTIPWANQQPKFVFPIFIEEGGGQRDTLYLGYDPNASEVSFDTMSQNFGVIPIHVDTNVFYAKWNAVLLCGIDTLCTEVYKANVCSTASWGAFPSDVSIICNKGIMPLKFSWDNTLFYSDSLPFPSNLPAPRGWGRITGGQFPFCGKRENFNPIIDMSGFFIVSDTVYFISTDWAKDSVTYYPLNGQIQSVSSGYIGFSIEAWNSPTNIESALSENYFNISSHESDITISCLKEEITISVYDLMGEEYLSKNIKSNEFFKIPKLKSNLYLLVINNYHFIKSFKILYYDN